MQSVGRPWCDGKQEPQTHAPAGEHMDQTQPGGMMALPFELSEEELVQQGIA